MGRDKYSVTSAVATWASSTCGRVEATEEVVFQERKWYAFSIITWSDLCDLYDLTSDEINNNTDFNSPICNLILT